MKRQALHDSPFHRIAIPRLSTYGRLRAIYLAKPPPLSISLGRLRPSSRKYGAET